MKIGIAALAILMCSAGAAFAQDAPPDQRLLRAAAAAVDPAKERETIARLVGFGTRHTMSETRSNRRGIGAARRWVESEFRVIGSKCQCFEIVTPSETVTGARLPTPTEVVDVLAIQRGATDPNRVIVISGHIDSRVTDPMNATSDAPGANDDASGVAAVMEAARVLSKHRFAATIVYAVLSGEEQGLYGGAILANYAKAASRMLRACACSPKARVPWRRRKKPTAAATTVAKWIPPRETSRASSTRWRSATSPASTWR